MDDLDNLLEDLDQDLETVVNSEITKIDVVKTEKQSDVLNSQKVQEYLINKDEEETKLTIEFAIRMLGIDAEIKELQDEKKTIRKEYKDEGVSTTKVNKVLTQLKSLYKQKDEDLDELDQIQLALDNNVDIKVLISNLVKK